MLPKIKTKIRSHIDAVKYYVAHKHVPNEKDGTRKVLFLDIRYNAFGRYLYLFLKFFHMEGYTVYMPKDLKLIRQLQCNSFTASLIQEKIVNFGIPPFAGNMITIDKKRLSADYFSGIANAAASGNIYVPMSQHPLMYFNGWWNTPVEDGKRKRSLFMAGNFDPRGYSKLDVFNVMPRMVMYSYLEKRKLLYNIEDQERMLSFLDSEEDGKIILVDRLKFDVPIWHMRWLLSRFEFYFALPGTVMPLCHNIIEAMSAGAIPFMQEEYARLFTPVLENGVHAITFRDENDLELRLNETLQLSPEKISFMRERMAAYYQEYLTPRSVVNRIEKPGQNNKIYLQAEEGSVKLFKKNHEQGIKKILSHRS